MEGQSLTLKCTVEYNVMRCGGLKALWRLEPGQYLTNLDRYLIHVNETQIPGKTGFRQRDVFVQFQQLSFSDTGRYQCIGECVLGPTAMGRFLSLTVAGMMSFTKSLGNKNNLRPLQNLKCFFNCALFSFSGFLSFLEV